MTVEVQPKILKPIPEKIKPVHTLRKLNSEIDLVTNTKPEYYKNTTSLGNNTFGEVVGVNLIEIPTINAQVVDGNENKVPTSFYPEKIPAQKTHWIFSITFDNDIFANSDYYFTNGIKIELSAPFLNSSPINKILPGSKNAQIQQSGFSIVQNIYTPTNPDTEEILIGDRPFSAYLTIGQFRETYNFYKAIHIKSELNLGVMGPSSYGREVQSSVHEIEPVGWVNQIENDIVISYAVRIDKGIVSSANFELNTSGRATVGTLYNKAGGGINLRFGNFMPVYQGPFSTFYEENPGGRYQFWIFAEANIDVIGYDATLQGGMFNKKSIYVIQPQYLNRFVFEACLGFALYYNNIGIEYKQFYLTPEFKGAKHFGWGQLKGVIAF